MLGIFVKGPWYSTFLTTKYKYSSQNSFFVVCRKVQTVTPMNTTIFLY